MEDYILASGLELQKGKIKLPHTIKRVKIDVGLSGNAPQAEIWTEHDKDLLVVGFEPLTQNRNMIEQFSSPWPIKLNPDKLGKTVFIIPVALSSKKSDFQMKMHITDGDAGSSSLLVPKGLKHSFFEYVPVYTLENFLCYFPFDKIKNIEHLKIDAQGMDLEILIGAGTYISNFNYITAELDQLYEGTKNSHFLLRFFLLRHGFIKIGFFTTIILKKVFKHHIFVDDPTFFNLRLLFKKSGPMYIYQRG